MLVRSAFALLVGAGLLAAPAGAKSPTGADYRDANCYLALSLFAASPPSGTTLSAEQRQSLDAASNYFLGRLKGRSPDLDLATVMTPVIIRDVRANLSAQLGACIAETDVLAVEVNRVVDMMQAAIKP